MTDKKVIIDGETGLITQEGVQKAGDVDFWELPGTGSWRKYNHLR